MRKITGAKIARIMLGISAATLMAVGMIGAPAQAHAVSAGNSTVLVSISANHRTLTVCKVTGARPAWGTVRYRNPSGPGESLVRYDAPAPGVCAPYALAANANAIRACETRTTGNNCSAWVPV